MLYLLHRKLKVFAAACKDNFTMAMLCFAKTTQRGVLLVHLALCIIIYKKQCRATQSCTKDLSHCSLQ